MKILVTGGSGFIGSNLLKKLDADIFDRAQGDIRDPSLDVSMYDTIYHLAAISSPRESEADRRRTWDINVNGTLNLLEKMSSGQRIVFASSAQVYDRSKSGEHTEDERLSPHNFYGLTKQIDEQLIEYYSRAKGFKYTILRFFNIYGPGQRPGFLVPDVVQKYQGRTVEIKNPDSRIDMVYVDDVVGALILAQKADGVFNIGTGEATPVSEVYRLVKECTASHADETVSEQEPYTLISNNGKARALGWKPTVGLGEGIERTVKTFLTSSTKEAP